MAIQIALETLLSNLVRIVTKRAVIDALRGLPLFLLENYRVCHIVRSIRRAFRIALSTGKERQIFSANNTVLIGNAVTELTSCMTSNVSDFDIFVPFRSHMSENTELILDTSHQFNVSVQYSLITLSEFEIVNGKIRLKHILHVNGGLRRVASTESVKCVHDSHVQINCLSLEQCTCWLALSQDLVDNLISEI